MLLSAIEKENYFSSYKLFAKTREGRDPAWLATLREKAADRFAALDFPGTRDEEWKYTNVAPILKTPYRVMFDLDANAVTTAAIAPFTFEESRRGQLVFINGLFSERLSDRSGLPAGIVAGNLSDIPAEYDKTLGKHLGIYADYRDQTFTALNTAHIGDGAFVYIPDGQAMERPIHLLFLSSGKDPISAHPRTLIVAGRGAIATVIESYAALDDTVYFTNAVTEVVAGEDAVVNHYRLQEEGDRTSHIGSTEVFQERGSHYTSVAVSLGAALSRHTLNAALAGERIETIMDGLYVVAEGQHHDSHTRLDHQRPHSASRQLYKGILDGRARAVFNGKVIVREGALLTDARQLNKNLLLSADAHVDTKPELEIFADDVKCAHGATISQLEGEELFYLASRGLSPERARALLTYGFAEDVIGRIKLKSVREQLDRIVLDKLHQTLEVK
jgi:Fe-S cluster assembly protein SufD